MENKMTKEDFVDDVIFAANRRKDKYPYLRLGQAVFNYVDENYGPVARQVQFEDGVDCFYIDDWITDFLDACWNRLKKEL